MAGPRTRTRRRWWRPAPLVPLARLALALLGLGLAGLAGAGAAQHLADRTINMALIVPAASDQKSMVCAECTLKHIVPVMDLALRTVRDRRVLPGYDLVLRSRDSNCSSTQGPLAAFEFIINKTVGEC